MTSCEKGDPSPQIDPKGAPVELQKLATIHSSNKGTNNIIEQNRINNKIITNNRVYTELKIGFHNINGIKGNPYKAQELIDLGQKEELDIIGIIETNIQEVEGRHIKIDRKNYSAYWSSIEKGKYKGSGVGIWINDN